MRIFNEKSILDCSTEEDIQKHNEEIQDILRQLTWSKNYECAAIIKFFDEINMNREPIIKQCKLYDCQDVTQFADIKNGVDLALVEGYLTFLCYGKTYVIDEKTYVTMTGIQIRPYDENREFVKIMFGG